MKEALVMTWPAFHSRAETLRAVRVAADARLDGRLPLDVPGVAERFEDPLDLLGALQLTWHTRLTGRLDRALASQPLDLDAAVVTAWREVATELPGVRLVLDHHREHPLDEPMALAVATATAKEQAVLALAAGRSDGGRRVPPVAGADLERRARAGWCAVPRRTVHRHPRPRPARRLHRLLVALAG